MPDAEQQNGEPSRIIAGAMSGTSADGVDVALVRVDGRGHDMTAEVLRHAYQPYPPTIRRSIFAVRQSGSVTLSDSGRITRELSLIYASAVKAALGEAELSAADLTAVAAHGQTMFHAPPVTLQWLDPALVAAEVGCPVVSDFRRADCAAGGQGAPLVPFADYVLFRHPTRTRVLLNIGGIANITFLPKGCRPSDVIAFDTGPGNCIIDHLVREQYPDGPGYDIDGGAAARGVSNAPLVSDMLSHPYFTNVPPKSTDGPAMIEVFCDARRRVGRPMSNEDMIRTACSITVASITGAITSLQPLPDELIVSGGGAKNPVVVRLLRESLGDLPIRTTDELGIASGAKEAVAFALLGAATLDGVPSNLPSATGARRAVVLGSVTPRP